ncbi:hypothetical protein HDU96_002443 [Phlyctochytrium bullatum]|nr:hypothetical protein HDU96_002443 [Phlyctochytrium bullatum]
MSAIRTLINRPSNGNDPNTRSPETMNFRDFVRLHAAAAYYVHGTAQFYPFHRALMWAWERAINSAGYGDGIPYWDWSVDAAAFQNAAVFGPNAFGTTGTLDSPCLPDGMQGRSQFSAVSFSDVYERFDCTDRPNCCLRRVRLADNSPTWPSEGVASSLDGANSYEEFRAASENTWHSNVHWNVGGGGSGFTYGDMAHGGYSPNDVLFYFHHAMIDKIWWRWQNACPSTRINSYGGISTPGGPSDSNLNDDLFGFPQFKVRDVMNAESLCYSYSNYQDFTLAPVAGCNPGRTTTSAGPSPSPSPSGNGSQDQSSSDGASSTSPTSTDSTASETTTTTSSTSAAPTANSFERVWFQGLIRQLVSQGVSFQAPSFLARRAYSNDSEVEPLPATIDHAPFSTTVPALPPTRAASTTSAAATATPTKCGFLTDEVYAPKEVKVGEYTVAIPEGMKVLYMDSFGVKVVPKDFTVNRTDGSSNYGRDVRPIAIYPEREIKYYTPTNTKCTPPPTPHPTMLSYPTIPDKSYFDMMGMDYQNAVEQQQKIMEWIDKCNCDEKCLSKAARVYHDYPDNPPEVTKWRETHNVTVIDPPKPTKTKCRSKKTTNPVPRY